MTADGGNSIILHVFVQTTDRVSHLCFFSCFFNTSWLSIRSAILLVSHHHVFPKESYVYIIRIIIVRISNIPFFNYLQVSDSSGSSHETTNFLSDDGRHHHDFISTRNPFVPQNLHSTPAQSAGGVCGSSYTQKSALNFRASSSNMQLGHGATSDESFQLVAENHSSRHPRPRSSMGWCNSNRHGMSRISDERYRSLSDEVLHHRIAYEVFEK